MLRYVNFSILLVSFTAGITLRAANKPHARSAVEASRTWTNEDLEELSKIPGLISVVGQLTSETPLNADASASQSKTEESAGQAASLRALLKTKQANLRDFQQALDDARELKTTTGGINLVGSDIGITPKATIEILQSRVQKIQSELDALDDLARHKGIPPGALRGESKDLTVGRPGAISGQFAMRQVRPGT